MAKPVVDRIENQLGQKAVLVRVDVGTDAGLQIAQRYGIRAIPSLLVLDSGGVVVYSHTGVPGAAAVLAAIQGLD